MIKIIFALLLCIPAYAKTYIVEIADFGCKYCKEAEHYTDKLRLEASANGDEFIFAPVVMKNGSKGEELFYYALRNVPKLEKFARETMFFLKQEQRLKMDNMDEVIDWVNIYNAHDEELLNLIEDTLLKATVDFRHVKAYIKAVALVDKLNIKSTPSFVIITQDGDMTSIEKPENLNTQEHINHVLEMYERISSNEK